MSRVLWFLMVLVALMMAPALCQSGVLAHDCACTAGVSDCGHEAACSEDPCGWPATVSFRAAPQTPAPVVARMPLFFAPQAMARPAHLVNQRADRFDLVRRDVEAATIVLLV